MPGSVHIPPVLPFPYTIHPGVLVFALQPRWASAHLTPGQAQLKQHFLEAPFVDLPQGVAVSAVSPCANMKRGATRRAAAAKDLMCRAFMFPANTGFWSCFCIRSGAWEDFSYTMRLAFFAIHGSNVWKSFYFSFLVVIWFSLLYEFHRQHVVWLGVLWFFKSF